MGRGPAAKTVALGVDGSSESIEAARYAAVVARERGWDLTVVHSYLVPPATTGMPAEFFRRAHADAETLVDKTLADLRLGTGTRVRRVVRYAPAVATLGAVSAEVSLLVLGRHHVNPIDRSLRGRVGGPVVAEARCPVVVVPPGWSRTGTVRRPVVVALDVEGPAREALRCAFEEAELRQAGLVALHAVERPGRTMRTEEQAYLGAVLAGAMQDHPDVPVRSLLVDGDPRERIVEESVHAGLLVVGRPHGGRHLGSWSRSVARAVLDRSHCPLLIAPPVALDPHLDPEDILVAGHQGHRG